ncbi:MAG: CYTH domain-containing protein [Chloroflexi bacterium]|nr:MAG: CYTH domain-containing protein [Chloroflexota bacterium]
MNKFMETEAKIHVLDLHEVEQRLIAAGAVLEAGRVLERNVRYENAEGSFTSQGIALRLRQDSRVRLTYKGPGDIVAGNMERLEAEVTVDDFDAMDMILRQLGYHPFILYEKYRTTYRLGDAEIVLDEMPYGSFVEIEGPPVAIETMLNRLALQDRPRIPMSYLALFNRVKESLHLNVHDLTFANFDGISVPPEIFESGG